MDNEFAQDDVSPRNVDKNKKGRKNYILDQNNIISCYIYNKETFHSKI